MRRVCYSVAMSLDGYIAGPMGEYDWITVDPGIDFEAVFARFDTLLIGRATYDMMRSQGHSAAMTGGPPGNIEQTAPRKRLIRHAPPEFQGTCCA